MTTSSTTLNLTTEEAAPKRRPRKSASVRIRVTPLQGVLLFVFLLTAARLAVIHYTDINLGPDEAQYWAWSKDFAFGYFSKPPMLAWIIASTTSICGDTEACVRLASPLFHAGTSLLLFALGSMLFGARAGVWAAVAYTTLPGITFSAALITTDVPLLFFWTATLVCLWKVIDTGKLAWAGAAGLVLGLALMSKYAALYLVLSMVLLMLTDKGVREAFIWRNGLIILVLAGLVLSPNIAWNLSNDFATVSHTAANANWGGTLFNPDKLTKFVGDQFGVFGPIMLTVFLWGLLTLRRRMSAKPYRRAFLFLLLTSLPPLIIVTAQAFISRANANWAAVAYPGATLLVAAWLLQVRGTGWLKLSVGLHLIVAGALYALLLNAQLIEDAGRGVANGFKRVRGWDDLGVAVQEQVRSGYRGREFSSVLVDDRLVYSELTYYARPMPGDVPLTMWDDNGVPENHFELKNPVTDESGRRALFLTRNTDPSNVLNRFSSWTPIGRFTSGIGGGRTRTFDLYMVEGFRQ